MYSEVKVKLSLCLTKHHTTIYIHCSYGSVEMKPSFRNRESVLILWCNVEIYST
jgi:hypothetical protein